MMDSFAISHLRLLDFRSLATCAVILSLVYAQDPVCFGPDGTPSDHLFSCDPNAAVSACCAAGDICYSNGLCAAGPTEDQAGITPFFWDGCTDSSFNSSACFSECYNLPGNGVQECQDAGPNRYCCYQYEGCDCADPSQVFSIATGTVLTTIDPSIKATTKLTTSTSSASSTSSGSTPISTSSATPAIIPTSSSGSTSDIARTAVSKSSSTSSQTSSPTLTNTSSPAISTTPPSQKSVSNNVAIGVGVGVGVPLILAVLALLYFLIRRQSLKSRNANVAPLVGPKPYHHEIGGYYNDTHAELMGQTYHQYNNAQSPPLELSAVNR